MKPKRPTRYQDEYKHYGPKRKQVTNKGGFNPNWHVDLSTPLWPVPRKVK